MQIVRFVVKSVALAPFVLLRLLPIWLFAGLIAFAAVYTASGNVFSFWLSLIVCAVLLPPFLTLQGIRAGLASLRMTDAPTLNGTIKATLHTALYLLVQAIAAVVIIVPVSLAVVMLAGPDAAGLGDTAGALKALAASGGMILGLALFSTVVIGLLQSVFAVPMAANAANAVQRSPGHDLIWGLGRKVVPLFAVYLIFSILPAMLSILPTLSLISSIGPDAAPGIMQTPTQNLVLGGISILGWFVILASFAIAYAEVRQEKEDERLAAQVVVFDHDAERDNIKALRELRLANAAGDARTVYSPDSTATPGKRKVTAGRPDMIANMAGRPVYDPRSTGGSAGTGAPPPPADEGGEEDNIFRA